MGAFFQLRKTDKPNTNLLSIITSDKALNWRGWENTKSGKRGTGYIMQKEKKAKELFDVAAPLLGDTSDAKLLDSYTSLTIRDWVASPDGSVYGILRSKDQLVKAASLSRTSVKGLYLAGQSVLAPGILGTVLGSLVTARDIAGAEVFNTEVLNKL